MARAGAERTKSRKEIADRIRALLAMTVERGCSESEALFAAKLAADLLEKHDLSLDEVEMRASPFAQPTSDHDDDVGERLWKVAAAIAKLTGSRYWREPIARGSRFHFLGLAHEAEIAGYLLDICARAMRTEVDRISVDFALFRPEVRRRRRAGFIDGMADTLSRRILAMRPPRPAGTGLVPVRDAILDEEMKKRGIDIKTGRSRLNRDFEDTYAPGTEAGRRIALDPGIRAPASPVAALGDLRDESEADDETESEEALASG